MGYAKYYEDDQELIQDRYDSRRIRTYSSWNAEKKYYKELVSTKDAKEKLDGKSKDSLLESDKKSLIERYLFLCSVCDSLEYRVNISLSASRAKTKFVQNIVLSYRIEIENTIEELNDELAKIRKNIGIYVERQGLTDEILLDTKNSFILQVIHSTFVAINNVETIELSEINSLMEDVSSLITWYKDEKRFNGALVSETLTNKEISDFINKEFLYDFVICNECKRETTSICKFCLNCGNKM